VVGIPFPYVREFFPTNSSSTQLVSSFVSSSNQQLPPSFLNDISSLNGVQISQNKYELDQHGKGEGYHESKPPLAVLTPESTNATSEIVKICAHHRVPIIPFGAGTSVEGHVAALHGGVSVDTKKLNRIELGGSEEDADSTLSDFYVTVGAGVTRLQLNDALRHTGLQFMVDPGADATIGGMVATGASGTTTIKYGGTRENILALEVVLPDGTIANCGTLGRKNSAGYDLTRLICGSEGTLGIITKATVKLHPIPSHVSSTVCSFPSLHDAADAVTTMIQSNIPLVRCELLDTKSIEAFNKYSCDVQDMPVKPHLFLEFSGISQTSLEEETSQARSICVDEFHAKSFIVETQEQERRNLWAARHKLYYASLALRPGATNAFVTDACVPISRFAELIQATSDDLDRDDMIVGTCFGHAGDGNFHCLMPMLPNDSEEYIGRVLEVNNRLIERTIAVGGTCTGEHGVGLGKIKYLPLQYGDGAVKMMSTIKKALDPLNIMNPGKIVAI